jgi:hypothetical protein
MVGSWARRRPVRRVTRRRSPVVVLVAVAVFVVAVVVPFLRGPFLLDTLWSEDGQIYWQQAHQNGGLAVLLHSYNGYLQLPPRLLGAVFAMVPLGHLAVVSALAGAVVAAAVAAFTYWATRDTVDSRWVRLALASLLVVGPALASENTANVTNVIWVLAAAAPVALLTRQRSRGAVVARAAVVFLAATSTPLTWLYVPMALVLLVWRRRDRATWVVTGLFGAGVVLQAAVARTGRDDPLAQVFRPSLTDHVQLFQGRVLSVFVFGTRGLVSLWADHADGLRAVATVAVLVIFAVLFVGAGRRAQLTAAVLIVTAVATFAVPLQVRGVLPLKTGRDVFSFTSMRFSVVPVFLLAYAAAVLVAPIDLGSTRRFTGAFRAAFVGLIIATTVVSFSITSVTSPRTIQPKLSQAVASARDRCLAQPDPRQGSEKVQYSFFYSVTVSCDELVDTD